MMQYYFEQGTNQNVLVLLHGTGADEHDLVPIAKMVDPDATILSLRGNVVESGMLRFFVRFPDGTFDYQNIDEQIELISNTITELILKHNLQGFNIYGLGFSNGANMLEAIIQQRQSVFKAVMLLAPVYVNPFIDFIELKNLPIYISTSVYDRYTTKEKMIKLQEVIEAKNGKLRMVWHDYGHSLPQNVLKDLIDWFKEL